MRVSPKSPFSDELILFSLRIDVKTSRGTSFHLLSKEWSASLNTVAQSLFPNCQNQRIQTLQGSYPLKVLLTSQTVLSALGDSLMALFSKSWISQQGQLPEGTSFSFVSGAAALPYPNGYDWGNLEWFLEEGYPPENLAGSQITIPLNGTEYKSQRAVQAFLVALEQDVFAGIYEDLSGILLRGEECETHARFVLQAASAREEQLALLQTVTLHEPERRSCLSGQTVSL